MGLTEYRNKRRFDVTAEPAGGKTPRRAKAKKVSYVIQKHRATALHYDFRLEWKGVLLSWAVPKGPSLEPKNRSITESLASCGWPPARPSSPPRATRSGQTRRPG